MYFLIYLKFSRLPGIYCSGSNALCEFIMDYNATLLEAEYKNIIWQKTGELVTNNAFKVKFLVKICKIMFVFTHLH